VTSDKCLPIKIISSYLSPIEARLEGELSHASMLLRTNHLNLRSAVWHIPGISYFDTRALIKLDSK